MLDKKGKKTRQVLGPQLTQIQKIKQKPDPGEQGQEPSVQEPVKIAYVIDLGPDGKKFIW